MHSHCRTPWRTRHWWKGSGQLITEIRAAGDRAEILSAEFVDQQDAQRFGGADQKAERNGFVSNDELTMGNT